MRLRITCVMCLSAAGGTGPAQVSIGTEGDVLVVTENPAAPAQPVPNSVAGLPTGSVGLAAN